MDVNLGKPQEMVRVREAWRVQSMGLQRVGHDWATEQQLLAWRIPWTEEPGGPQFIGSQRVRHS